MSPIDAAALRPGNMTPDQLKLLERLLAEQGAAPAPVPGIRPHAVDRTHAEPSSAQRRIWFFDRLQPGSALYTISGSPNCAAPSTARCSPAASPRSYAATRRCAPPSTATATTRSPGSSPSPPYTAGAHRPVRAAGGRPGPRGARAARRRGAAPLRPVPGPHAAGGPAAPRPRPAPAAAVDAPHRRPTAGRSACCCANWAPSTRRSRPEPSPLPEPAVQCTPTTRPGSTSACASPPTRTRCAVGSTASRAPPPSTFRRTGRAANRAPARGRPGAADGVRRPDGPDQTAGRPGAGDALHGARRGPHLPARAVERRPRGRRLGCAVAGRNRSEIEPLIGSLREHPPAPPRPRRTAVVPHPGGPRAHRLPGRLRARTCPRADRRAPPAGPGNRARGCRWSGTCSSCTTARAPG